MTKQLAKSFCAGITALLIIASLMSACGETDQISQVSSTAVKTKNAALITPRTEVFPVGCYKVPTGTIMVCPPGNPSGYVRPSKPMYVSNSASEGSSCALQFNAISASNPAMSPGKNSQGQTDDFVCWLSSYRPAGVLVNPVWYRESTLLKAALSPQSTITTISTLSTSTTSKPSATTVALSVNCIKSISDKNLCPGDPGGYIRPSKPMYVSNSASEGSSCAMQWNAISASNPAMFPGKNAQGQTDDFVCWLSSYRPAGVLVNPVWYRESTLQKAAQTK